MGTTPNMPPYKPLTWEGARNADGLRSRCTPSLRQRPSPVGAFSLQHAHQAAMGRLNRARRFDTHGGAL